MAFFSAKDVPGKNVSVVEGSFTGYTDELVFLYLFYSISSYIRLFS